MRYASLFLLFIILLCLTVTAIAEDTGYDICYPNAMEATDSSGKPQILYTARANNNLRKLSQPDTQSQAVGTLRLRDVVNIFGFDQYWLFCWDEKVGVYYLRRHNVVELTPVSEDVPPYGVIYNAFIAVTSKDTVLYASPDKGANQIDRYPAGTRMSFWLIKDGWAVVPYKRLVGYIYLGDLEELTPVAPTVEYAQEGDIIAAFTTFYSVATTKLNVGRMENIRVGCAYISKTYQPGEEFDFNGIAGPYRRNRGYMPSPVLIDGATVSGYGGGTCQVSTTLYNTILQIPEGITILFRKPHGPSGASYAPHGVDAAVGREDLNLVFRNDFSFPITLDCTAQNGSLCICIRKGEYALPQAETSDVLETVAQENDAQPEA